MADWGEHPDDVECPTARHRKAPRPEPSLSVRYIRQLKALPKKILKRPKRPQSSLYHGPCCHVHGPGVAERAGVR